MFIFRTDLEVFEIKEKDSIFFSSKTIKNYKKFDY